jgi:hypothetical protein
MRPVRRQAWKVNVNGRLELSDGRDVFHCLEEKQAVPTTIIIETASLVDSCPSSCEKSKRSEDKVRSGSCVTLKTSGPKTIIIVAS